MKGSAFYGKAPMKFNTKLKQASADGKLSGEFKKAVDNSPANMYDSPTKMKSPAKLRDVFVEDENGVMTNMGTGPEAIALANKEIEINKNKQIFNETESNLAGEFDELYAEGENYGNPTLETAGSQAAFDRLNNITQGNVTEPSNAMSTKKIVLTGPDAEFQANANYRSGEGTDQNTEILTGKEGDAYEELNKDAPKNIENRTSRFPAT